VLLNLAECLVLGACSDITVDRDLIATTVSLHQVVRRTIADDSTVDHDSDMVAKLLCFVHSVSSQHNTRVFQLFNHLEQTSAGDRVHT